MPMPRKQRSLCPVCGKEPRLASGKYCNNICQQAHQHSLYIDRWLDGVETGFSGGINISNHIRKYLFDKHSNCCELCGWSQLNLYTKSIPLEVHHKDGNYANNRPENLQLLCPNCHSLTATNGILNKGNGRPYTKIYK